MEIERIDRRNFQVRKMTGQCVVMGSHHSAVNASFRVEQHNDAVSDLGSFGGVAVRRKDANDFFQRVDNMQRSVSLGWDAFHLE